MRVGFGYGILCDPLEKQANEQGFTLLKKLNNKVITSLRRLNDV